MRENGVSSYHRYLQGEGNALEELVLLYSDQLVRYAYCFIHDHAAAEDIAEDAFVALIFKKRKFESEAQLRAFLFKTVRNRCYDALRARRRVAPFEEWFLPPQNLEQALETRERDRNLRIALQSLRAEYRDVLYLTYLEGFSVAECGEILKKSAKQIYNLLARAKTALREKLIQEGINYENIS